MKRIYPLALLAATGAILVTNTSLRVSETDDRIAGRSLLAGAKAHQHAVTKLN